MGQLIDVNETPWHRQQKEKAKLHQQSLTEAALYLNNLKKSVENFKANLSKEVMPKVTSPTWLHSYSIHMWDEMPFPQEEWMTDETKKKIDLWKAGLPERYMKYVDHTLTYSAFYVPRVVYEVVMPPSSNLKYSPVKLGTGTPSLTWMVAIHIITTIDFWEREGMFCIPRCDFDQYIKCLGENLGRMYAGPEFWYEEIAFVTPIKLLAFLASEKAVMSGVEVISRIAPWNIYRVEGFLDDICLHDDFRRLIRDMAKKAPLDEALLSRNMCDEETGLLIKANLEKFNKSPVPAAGIQQPQNLDFTEDDLSNIVIALTNLGFTKNEAIKAADYVYQNYGNEKMEKKIAQALQYLSV